MRGDALGGHQRRTGRQRLCARVVSHLHAAHVQRPAEGRCRVQHGALVALGLEVRDQALVHRQRRDGRAVPPVGGLPVRPRALAVEQRCVAVDAAADLPDSGRAHRRRQVGEVAGGAAECALGEDVGGERRVAAPDQPQAAGELVARQHAGAEDPGRETFGDAQIGQSDGGGGQLHVGRRLQLRALVQPEQGAVGGAVPDGDAGGGAAESGGGHDCGDIALDRRGRSRRPGEQEQQDGGDQAAGQGYEHTRGPGGRQRPTGPQWGHLLSLEGADFLHSCEEALVNLAVVDRD